jgi:nicotinate phosphoribosyltransferase
MREDLERLAHEAAPSRGRDTVETTPSDRHPLKGDEPAATALLTDLYQLTMMQAYYETQTTAPAAFEFFARKLPATRNFFVAAGLDQVLDYLECLRFTDADIAWLRGLDRFSDEFLDRLRTFRFSGDVDAMPEGTVFFPHEPILRVVAPLPEAQLVETRIVNLLHLETVIASKAARFVLAAPGKTLVDFGLRRAHGAEAGLLAARAAYIAGFDGTATVLAGQRFGIPLYGTMAHSFVQAYDSEVMALERFARAYPKGSTLLIDTYDTEAAAAKVVRLAPRLREAGIRVAAVRIDSGDLGAHARQVRQILDAGGLADVKIFASGGLDEYLVERLARESPIDGFGVGTNLVTSQDAPGLDCAYKLQEYAGRARRKRSEGKATWPGRKQVYRTLDTSNRMVADVLTLEGEVAGGVPLMQPVMRAGRRIAGRPPIAALRERAAASFAQLPAPLRELTTAAGFIVQVAPCIRRLADEVDAYERAQGMLR